jgi:hypothetical protein
MRLNKILCMAIAAASCGMATVAPAQTARQIDRHVAKMRRFLHLSGVQAGTIRGDYFAASDEKKAIAHNRSFSPFQRQEKIREVTRDTNRQIAAVLSPPQLDQWKTWRREESGF